MEERAGTMWYRSCSLELLKKFRKIAKSWLRTPDMAKQDRLYEFSKWTTIGLILPYKDFPFFLKIFWVTPNFTLSISHSPCALASGGTCNLKMIESRLAMGATASIVSQYFRVYFRESSSWSANDLFNHGLYNQDKNLIAISTIQTKVTDHPPDGIIFTFLSMR